MISLFFTILIRQKFVKNRRNILKRFETKHGITNTKNIVAISARNVLNCFEIQPSYYIIEHDPGLIVLVNMDLLYSFVKNSSKKSMHRNVYALLTLSEQLLYVASGFCTHVFRI